MHDLPASDDALSGLEGRFIDSEMEAGVRYNIQRTLGVGGMAVAFLANRVAKDGESPVVLKVLRPSVVHESERAASLMVRKEAVALGRLNEQVPATPFVVRLIDTGALPARINGHAIALPWLAVEYVHGGPEGTTLEDRVSHCVRTRGQAFDPGRAAHAISSLATGISAIHEVGVIHRDLTPVNVLCCGYDDDELFKIADFGIARPAGMAATFGGIAIGTPGYAPPEQFGLDESRVASWSDVFSFACVIYYLLTGEEYFPVHAPAEGVLLVRKPERRRLVDSRSLSAELRSRTAACEAIDSALGRATSADPLQRPPSAQALAQLIVPALRPTTRMRPSDRGGRRARPTADTDAETLVAGWSWSTRHLTESESRSIRGVAWDGDGRCLAATSAGLSFWDGTRWIDAQQTAVPQPQHVRFARKLEAGVWLIGGDSGLLATYGPQGVGEVLVAPNPSLSFRDASGDLADLGVLVAETPDTGPMLYGVAAARWVRPATLPRIAAISSLSRLSDDSWLVTGRSLEGDGVVLRYRPLMWDVERLAAPTTRAYLASAARPELGLGVVVGAEGGTLRIQGEELIPSVIAERPDLSAVGVDRAGVAWAASVGQLWLQRPSSTRWGCVWSDSSWQVPFISVFADVGRVIALTADGGILEGRLGLR